MKTTEVVSGSLMKMVSTLFSSQIWWNLDILVSACEDLYIILMNLQILISFFQLLETFEQLTQEPFPTWETNSILMVGTYLCIDLDVAWDPVFLS